METGRKSEVTRQKIVDAALELFAERGYEQATMRLIAQRAGVSLGNAYYYFSSKEELMQGYYEGFFSQFLARAEPVLGRGDDFVESMIAVLETWIDSARPYHDFAGGFFRHAADPASPLSPFSAESSPTRERSIALYRRLVDGSRRLKMADEIRERLPELLWLYQMGVVLYWVFDSSADQEKSKELVRRTVPMIARLLAASRLPVLRSTARDVMQLIADLTPAPRSVDGDGAG